MRDEISIGPTPAAEKCECLGPEYDPQKALAECKRFIRDIRHALGDEPLGAFLKVRHNPHDFGTYLDVVCVFDDTQEAAVEYAYRCESDAPTEWWNEIEG